MSATSFVATPITAQQGATYWLLLERTVAPARGAPTAVGSDVWLPLSTTSGAGQVELLYNGTNIEREQRADREHPPLEVDAHEQRGLLLAGHGDR